MLSFARICLGLAVASVAALVPQSALMAGDDVARGEAVFMSNCIACHALPNLDQNMIGPSLYGVVGRHSGRANGFSYSIANTQSNLIWTESNLDAYLADPKSIVPPRSFLPWWSSTSTKMTFSGLKDAADRKAVITYLNDQIAVARSGQATH